MNLLQKEIIEGRVLQSIEDSLGNEFEDISVEKESLLFEDMGADSIDTTVIQMGLEEDFEIEIEDSVIPTWKSVQDIINYITQRMEEIGMTQAAQRIEHEVQISRNYGFEAAHYIPNHKGLCKQLHGHSYTGKVTIAGGQLDDMGMIMDYGDLKVIIQDAIEKKFDHAMLNDTFQTPTAEVMVLDFFTALKNKLSADHPGVRLVEVTLKETADSEAVVRA